MVKSSDIRLIQMSQYIRPKVEETNNKDWVLNGKNNEFYDYIINRKNGSPTNATIINSYVDRVYGQGLRNTNGRLEDWIKFKAMLRPDDVQRVVSDFVLFGEASMQIVKANGRNRLPKVYHLPKENTAPEKVNEDNEIEGYYYSENWKKVNQNPPEYLPILGNSPSETESYAIRPYSAGKKYFSDPTYLAGLPYATMEEEIANYYVNHINNGLSFGYIINIPDDVALTPEEKDDMERRIKQKLTGSSNAGKFILSFQNGDVGITVVPLEGNDSHKQWEYLTTEARQQLLTAHGVTSPMLFGIKDNTGLGNNADELKQASLLLQQTVIKPKQRALIEAFEEIAHYYELNVDLEFIPLFVEEKEPEVEAVKMSETKSLLDEFIELGESEPEGYYLEESFIVENDDELLQFASTKTGTARPTAKSKDDNEDVLIRYRYTGNPDPEREFCVRMMDANKIYRREDIDAMKSKAVNPGFGMDGTDTYDIWLYKGGGLLSKSFPAGTCKHKWQMEIYAKNGTKIDPRSPLAKTITRRRAIKRGFEVPTDKGTPFKTPHSTK